MEHRSPKKVSPRAPGRRRLGAESCRPGLRDAVWLKLTGLIPVPQLCGTDLTVLFFSVE